MLDIIRGFCGHMKDSDLEHVCRLEMIFQDNDVTAHNLELTEISALKDVEDGDKALMMISVYVKTVATIMAEWGIFLNEIIEGSVIGIHCEIFESLVSATTVDNHDFLYQLDNEADPILYICAIVEEFMEKPAIGYYDYFAEVDPNFVANLQKEVRDEMEQDEVSVDSGATRAELITIAADPHVDTSKVIEYAINVNKLPTTVEAVLSVTEDHLELIRDPKLLAFELYALMVISHTPKPERDDWIRQWLDSNEEVEFIANETLKQYFVLKDIYASIVPNTPEVTDNATT